MCLLHRSYQSIQETALSYLLFLVLQSTFLKEFKGISCHNTLFFYDLKNAKALHLIPKHFLKEKEKNSRNSGYTGQEYC